jgi:hypothetical protein
VKRPSVYIAIFTLANAAVAGVAWTALDWMSATRFDQAGKYATAALFLAATSVLLGFAVRRLQIGFLYTFVVVSAAFNVAVSHILMVLAHGPYSLVKGDVPFSTEHLFMFGVATVFVAFCYALLVTTVIIVLVRLRVPIASTRLAADLGMDEGS